MEYRSRENSAVFIKPDIKRDLQKCKIMSLFSIIFFFFLFGKIHRFLVKIHAIYVNIEQVYGYCF